MNTDKKLENTLKGLVIESFNTNYSHDAIPGLNTNKYFSLNNLNEFQLSPFNTTYPYPLLMKCGPVPSYDSVIKLVKEKKEYFKRLEALKWKYKFGKKPDLNNIINTKKNLELFVKFIEEIELDPDPYFDFGTYNWFYTGGDLSTYKLPNNKYLLLFGNTEKNIFELDAVTLNLNSKEEYVVSKYVTRDIKLFQDNILEIISNNTNILVRQRHKVSIIDIDDNSTLTQKFEINSELPFISGDFLAKNNKTVCSIDSEKILKIWDLNRSVKSPKLELKLGKKDENYDNWVQIKTIDFNKFVYADRKILNIYDYRESLKKTSFGNENILHNSFEKCDKISCIEKSIFEHIIYVGTIHNLFAIDLRFFTYKSIEDSNIVIKWVHQMKSTPLIIKTIRSDENTEIVLLSSCNETCMYLVKNDNTDKESIVTSYSLPLKLKNIKNTFNVAQRQGKCIDPTNPLSDHLDKCISGLGAININGKISIITKNSVDDIFIQHLTENTNKNYDTKRAVQNMDLWSREISINCEYEKEFTYVTNLNHMKTVFNCKSLKKLTAEELENEPIRQTRVPRWQQSVDRLYKYTDALASSLLDVFDLKDSKIDMESFSDSKSLLQESKLDVSEWVNAISNINDCTMEDDIFETATNNENITKEETEDLLMSTQNTIVKDKTKKKKKHIVGF